MNRKLSSFDIYTLVKELQQKTEGCIIEKTYQISQNEILIRIKNIQNKEKNQIYIKNGEIICITNKEFEKPTKPSNFAMALRKYLQNGRITDIIQHEFDRIIQIKISKKNGTYSLIIEFFSDGNIILTDPEEKIILPFTRQTWAHRKVKGREKYIPPPSQLNPFKMDKTEFKKVLKDSSADIVRTLAANINLSGFIAEEICTLAEIDKNTKTTDLDEKTITKIYKTLQSFLNIFKENKIKPVFVKKQNEKIDVLPFEFKSYNNYSFEQTNTMIQGFEIFIPEKQEKQQKTESKIDKKIGKLQRQKKQQETTIQKFEKQIKQKKIEGDLIYLHYQEIEQILNNIKDVLNLKEKTEDIQKINNYELVNSFDPKNNTLILNLKGTKNEIHKTKIDFRKTVSENAEKSYDDNKKIRKKLKGAEKALEKTREKIKNIEQEKTYERKKQKEIEKNKKTKQKSFWFERYRWFISSNNNIVIGGKDAKTNDIIVKKYLKEGDRYAHAEIQGAPSIVIKRKGIDDKKIEITEQTLEEACIFAACFSKAWKQFAEAQSYWVLPEQVSKTAQSGEFVPKGAFIIRGKRNYHRVKLELAVGLIEIEENLKVMSGPVSTIKKHTDKYVIINPGPVKKNDIAHKISKSFNTNVDDVDHVLPPGGCSIVETKGVNL